MQTALVIAGFIIAALAGGGYLCFRYQRRIIDEHASIIAGFGKLYDEKKGVECRNGTPVSYDIVRVGDVWHERNEHGEIVGKADPDLLDYLEQKDRFGTLDEGCLNPFQSEHVDYLHLFGIRVLWDPSVIPPPAPEPITAGPGEMLLTKTT